MLEIWGRRNSSNVIPVMWAVGETGTAYRRHDVGGLFGGLDTPEYLGREWGAAAGLVGPVGRSEVAFALRAFARQLAGAPNRLGGLTDTPLRRLLVSAAHLHLTENSLALHLLLERAQSLIDIVVADDDLNQITSPGLTVRLIA